MPKVDKKIYQQKWKIDDLAFNKEDIIVLEGNALLNFPLQEIMSQHYSTRSSLTLVVRELDLTQKPKIIIKNEGFEIVGYCDLPKSS
jgi:ADP-glucose pyrophosphorylase